MADNITIVDGGPHPAELSIANLIQEISITVSPGPDEDTFLLLAKDEGSTIDINVEAFAVRSVSVDIDRMINPNYPDTFFTQSGEPVDLIEVRNSLNLLIFKKEIFYDLSDRVDHVVITDVLNGKKVTNVFTYAGTFVIKERVYSDV